MRLASEATVVFRSTDTVSSARLAMARSARPSPLKSPTATEPGESPTAKSARVNPPSPLFASTVTLLVKLLTSHWAVTMSALPSPSKSPIATECGSGDGPGGRRGREGVGWSSLWLLVTVGNPLERREGGRSSVRLDTARPAFGVIPVPQRDRPARAGPPPRPFLSGRSVAGTGNPGLRSG